MSRLRRESEGNRCTQEGRSPGCQDDAEDAGAGEVVPSNPSDRKKRDRSKDHNHSREGSTSHRKRSRRDDHRSSERSRSERKKLEDRRNSSFSSTLFTDGSHKRSHELPRGLNRTSSPKPTSSTVPDHELSQSFKSNLSKSTVRSGEVSGISSPTSSFSGFTTGGTATSRQRLADVESELPTAPTNPVEERISQTASDCAEKKAVGPDLSEAVGEMLSSLVSRPNVETVKKLAEKYPRPGNVPWLQAPRVGDALEESIKDGDLKFDNRLRFMQELQSNMITAFGSALDDIRTKVKEDPSLNEPAQKIIDGLVIGAFVQRDFTTLRRGTIKQKVNRDYAAVFAKSSEDPMVLVEGAVGERLNKCDEMYKIKQRLTAQPRSTMPGKRDFHQSQGKKGRNRQHQGYQRGGYNRRGSYNGYDSHRNNPQRGGKKNSHYSGQNQQGDQNGYPQQNNKGQNHQERRRN